MKIWDRIRCSFGVHRRDRHEIHRVGTDFYSICKGCGAPMTRDGGGWRIDPAAKVDR